VVRVVVPLAATHTHAASMWNFRHGRGEPRGVGMAVLSLRLDDPSSYDARVTKRAGTHAHRIPCFEV
jgi:hypothetical protein